MNKKMNKTMNEWMNEYTWGLLGKPAEVSIAVPLEKKERSNATQ